MADTDNKKNMPSEFIVEIGDGNDSHTKVIHLSGELDEINVDELKNQIDPYLNDSSVLQIIFDLTKLVFINSKGIGYLVSIHTDLAKESRAMSMAGATKPVMDVLSLVGITNIIPYHATLEEALNK